MKKTNRMRSVSIVLFLLSIVLFSAFFFYLRVFEGSTVHNARPMRSYAQVADYTEATVTDPSAPVGFRKEYTWTLDASGTNENSLFFYALHEEVRVFIGGIPTYTLQVGRENRVAKATGGSWVSVPIYPSDTGKPITVTITPLFDSVADRTPEFYVGSLFAMFFDQLRSDMPQLFLSFLCMILGLFIIFMTLWLGLNAGNKMYNMLFLGIFAILLGAWRVSDTRSSPILLPGNPMFLNYVSIGILFLLAPPLLIFLDMSFKSEKPTVLTIASPLLSTAAIVVLVLQMLGVAEFKQMLTVSHFMILIGIILIAVESFRQRGKVKNSIFRKSHRFIVLLLVGVILDLTVYYIGGDSAKVIYSILSFVLYAAIIFAANVFDTSRRANRDGHTGLVNKGYWDELMDDRSPVAPTLAIIMMDINNLKQVNDSLGHDAGDRLILNFANILRNTLPRHSVICRWGGDEFAVLLTETTREQVERSIQDVRDAADACSTSPSEPPISFGAGFALAGDYPGLSRRELVAIADSQMYRDKQLRKELAAKGGQSKP